ncbi:hypothetical protein HRbin19_00586 [bacterium HR19]|nr:hypothetical protein HRbin19_00586 [bacterium HR19]
MIGKKTFGKLLVFLFGFGLLYFGCAGGKEEGGTIKKDITQLDPNTQQEIQSNVTDSVGEVSLLTETELNPLLIEASIQEVNLLTGRAPHIIGKEDSTSGSDDIENEVKSELKFEEALTLYLSDSEIEKIEKLKHIFDENAEKLGKRYAGLIRDLMPNLKSCYNKNWSCEKLKLSSSPLEISCSKAVISSCKVGNYDVSGEFSISATITSETNFTASVTASVTFNNLKFSKSDDKYVNFIAGTVTADVKPGEASYEVKDIKIDDTEEGRYVSGSGKRTINWNALDKSSFNVSLTDYSTQKEYKLNGDVSANISKSSFQTTYNLNLTADFGTISVKGSHKREKSDNPKSLLKETSVDVSFSSASTQFSVSAYRYKYIQPASEGEFALAITNTLRVNDNIVKLYSHNLTIVKDKDDKKFILSGKTSIQKENGKSVDVSFENLVLEKGCNKPSGGKTISNVRTKDGKVFVIEVSFRSGCVCETDVVVKKDNEEISVKNFDICEAGEKIKEKIREEVKTKSK